MALHGRVCLFAEKPMPDKRQDECRRSDVIGPDAGDICVHYFGYKQNESLAATIAGSTRLKASIEKTKGDSN